MFKKIFTITIFSLFIASSFLAAVEYEVQDIGTLQTRESRAITINNQGQILGWYDVDGSANGKHFFVRDREGTFYEVPRKENGTGTEVNWRFLKDDGKVYGTFDGNTGFSVLYVWDKNNGLVKLGNLPGKDIVTINNSGQVLIRMNTETENGRSKN